LVSVAAFAEDCCGFAGGMGAVWAVSSSAGLIAGRRTLSAGAAALCVAASSLFEHEQRAAITTTENSDGFTMAAIL
jgi:hypothetical protein